MHTLRLQVNDKIYNQLMVFLGRFNHDEIEVIVENEDFKNIQTYLHKELVEIETGNADSIDIDELDASLEQTIKKYEA